MIEFWNERAPREKLLIVAAGLLTVILVLWQFMWLPAQDYRERAKRGFMTAAEDLQFIKNSTIALNARNNPATANTPLQSVVVDVANVYGLTISRIEPNADGGLTLWFEGEEPQTLFAWLRDLDSNHGVRVGKASIRRMQDGEAVNANLYVERSR